MTNSTLSGNDATYGGGISNFGTAKVTNTIVAGNGSSADIGPDVDGRLPITSGGHNVIGKTDGSSGWTGTDKTGTAASPLDPLLGPLSDNGGPTRTIPLLRGSLAIDAGDDAVCAAPPVSGVDQRGATRPQGAHCDIGAFEYTVINPLPGPKPPGPVGGPPSPLPAVRPAAPRGGSAPNPLPVPRP